MNKRSFKDTIYGDMSGRDYKGTIDIRGLELNSWEGAPKTFWGEFYATGNNFKNFKGSPIFLNGAHISMSGVKTLKSLDGLNCEGTVSDFNIAYSSVKNFKGAPDKVLGMFGGHDIDTLESVDGLSRYVGGRLLLHGSSIKNLNGYQPLNEPRLISVYNTNTYIELEFITRLKHPGLTDTEYQHMLYELTNDTCFLSQEAKEIFIF